MTLKIYSWNVNGIRAVHKKGFLKWFLENSPGILCVQETKANADQLPRTLTDVPGYYSYFKGAKKKGYSGVALYTKIKPEKVEYGFGISKFDDEGRTIVAHYKEFVLLNIYFPNGKMSKERLQYKLDFYDALLDYTESLRKMGKNLIICGDLNTAHKEIDLARPKANEKISGFLPEERAWIDKFLDCGYLDTFRIFSSEPEQYTWWSYRTRARERNVGWRLDYFFINKEFKDKIESSYILNDVFGSDHCPVGLDVHL